MSTHVVKMFATIGFLAIALCNSAHAAWGDLDCSFGNNGSQPLGAVIGVTPASAFSIAIEPDGNILARAGSTGSTNATLFVRVGHDGGLLPIASPAPSTNGVGQTNDVVLPDGKILLITGTGGHGAPPGVARYLSDGTLDTTFGTNGYAVAGGLSAVRVGPIVQADGKIVIGGGVNGIAALVRFTPDGTPDPTYGTSGVAPTVNASVVGYHSLDLQPDGRIVTLGFGNTGVFTYLARHLVDGSPDPSFGTGGSVQVAPPVANGLQVRVQPSGKILLTYYIYYTVFGPFNLSLARYDSAGVLETTRNVTIPGAPAGQSQMGAFAGGGAQMELMADGRPIFFGNITGQSGGGLVRMNADLTDDVGVVRASYPSLVRALPDGKMLLGGTSITRLMGDTGTPVCRTATTTTLLSSPNPSQSGQTVTLTATVAPSGATGTVQFRDGTTYLEPPVALTSGTAMLVTSALAEGSHSLSAVYSGDASFSPSTSTASSHSVYGRLTIGDNTANGANGPTTLSFLVSLTSPPASTVTVDYATANGSAIAGTDYVATSGTLTFNAGQMFKYIDVTIQPTQPGAARSFSMVLANPANATLAKGTATGTIIHQAAGTLTITIDDPSVFEGRSGTTLLGFNVALSQASTTSLTVDYATANGSAVAGTDYTAQSGTLTFPPGLTSRWVMVPVLGNTAVDGNRTVLMTLANATAGSIAKLQGTGTIVDDDPTTAASPVAMLRLYSNVTKEHLYTTDSNEYNVLGTQGWAKEGTAYTMFRNAGSYGTQYAIPFYRMYHAGIQQHHWTTDPNEVVGLAAQGTWAYEGITGYLLSTSDAGSTPLHRLMYTNPPLHLWTIDANEKNVLTSQYGWVYEGVVGEVLP